MEENTEITVTNHMSRRNILLGVVICLILLTPLLYLFMGKKQAPNKTAYVGEKSSYKASDIEKSPAFLSKEALPDGAIKYLLSSHLPSRPNMYIIKNGKILLQRSITQPNYPVKMSDYTTSYGEPPVVKELVNFYDPAAKLYVYPNEKLAFIANPQTGDVLEQHVFTISMDEYLQKYSEARE